MKELYVCVMCTDIKSIIYKNTVCTRNNFFMIHAYEFVFKLFFYTRIYNIYERSYDTIKNDII